MAVTEGILVAPFVHQRIPITESEPITFNSIIIIPFVWFYILITVAVIKCLSFSNVIVLFLLLSAPNLLELRGLDTSY